MQLVSFVLEALPSPGDGPWIVAALVCGGVGLPLAKYGKGKVTVFGFISLLLSISLVIHAANLFSRWLDRPFQ